MDKVMGGVRYTRGEGGGVLRKGVNEEVKSLRMGDEVRNMRKNE